MSEVTLAKLKRVVNEKIEERLAGSPNAAWGKEIFNMVTAYKAKTKKTSMQVAQELGVGYYQVTNMLKRERKKANRVKRSSPTPKSRARVTASAFLGKTFTVVAPNGYKVEGLSMAEAKEFLN